MYDYWDEVPEERISPSDNPVLATFNKEAAKEVSQVVMHGIFGKPKADICANVQPVHRYQPVMRQYPRLVICVY